MKITMMMMMTITKQNEKDYQNNNKKCNSKYNSQLIAATTASLA